MSGQRAGAAAATLRGALGPPPAYGRPAAVPPPAPAAAAPPASRRRSKYTLLLSPFDALAFDGLQLQLRRRLGRRVDKSELVRALVALAEDDPSLLDQVAAYLGRDGMPS